MDEIITKRLHISGLTPALTPGDLSKRLATFGTVTAVDGFGLQDGLGQPRKFGYVTLETTQGKLARCLNLLSGSTWKGAKLRIGEAKPDFAERLAKEREAAASEPPKKKRKRCAGVEAADMSLVTPETAVVRGGWKVTPLGRVVRSVRMRPEHPLPPPNEDKEKRAAKGKKKGDEEKKKRKKRVKEPDVRARRRTIDVTRYGSVHLKGMFLEMDVLGTKRVEEVPEVVMVDEGDSDSDSEDEAEVEAVVEPSPPAPSLPTPPPSAPSPNPETQTLRLETNDPAVEQNINVTAEKSHSLNLLASLFGDKDEDWVGKESVGSDVDEAELAKRHHAVLDGDDDGEFEVVPMDGTVEVGHEEEEEEEQEDEEQDEEDDKAMEVEDEPPAPPPTEKAQQATKLKDLFAPREEEAGFSLLGHLDLDLELDDEIPFAITDDAPAPAHTPTFSVSAPTPVSAVPTFNTNTKHPLFFPLPPATGVNTTKARPKDIFDVARENKWHWRDPSVGFFRTGTDEEIRKRWEENKVELTREWKRRCREAGKVSRRRRGGDVGDEESLL